MIAKYYAQVDLIYIVILLSLVYQTIKSNFTKIDKIHFLVLLGCTICFAFSDLIWLFNNNYLSYSIFGDGAYLIGGIANNLNVILSGMTSLSWLFFSESIQRKTIFKDNKKLYIALIPELVLIVLAIVNSSTGILFTIDSNLQYSRNMQGYIYQIIVVYGYLGVAALLSLIRANKADTVQEKELSIASASFLIAPAIACAIQLVFSNMSILFMGIVVSLLNVYLSLQRQLVLNDALTGLNNRSRLDQKINQRIKSLNNDSDFWLLIMDADNFKHINDTYGHVEGDKALILIANALRRGCDDSDFICRYGGDEFVVLHNSKKGEDCSTLTNRIDSLLSENKLDYPLTVSIGYAKYDSSISDWSSLVKKADEKLYKIKAKKKALR